jgi:hypothetical protein
MVVAGEGGLEEGCESEKRCEQHGCTLEKVNHTAQIEWPDRMTGVISHLELKGRS